MKATPGPESPIFIIGTERSGSNLLRLMLDAHSRLCVPHPPHFMRYLATPAGSYGDLTVRANRRAAAEDAVGLLRRHIHPWQHPIDPQRVVEEAAPSLFGVVAAVYDQYREAEGAARWGCKSTFMVDHVDEALAHFPEARFIWLVRDPCDVGSSAKRSIFGYSHPYRMAHLWRRQQEQARAALARWGPETVHLLHYEDLVSRPREEIERLCSFLAEEFEPAMLEHHRSPAARRTAGWAESWRNAGTPVTTERIGAHQAGLTRGERLLVDKVTGPLKRDLGYPVDPQAHACPAPSPVEVAVRSAALRLRVEFRSLKQDRNYSLRLGRDVYVRWLRLRAHARVHLRRRRPMAPSVAARRSTA
ncbi:sulfotransferase family protein [Streptomyces sp. NPDC018045]|uniref:sulfotransferase family protein n=1 Tax=Streptomyces sp. NPDC018045 TaxID=3365037 RepID=UPI0037A9C8F0